jgi:hypothetical protein
MQLLVQLLVVLAQVALSIQDWSVVTGAHRTCPLRSWLMLMQLLVQLLVFLAQVQRSRLVQWSVYNLKVCFILSCKQISESGKSNISQ